jgi:esterase
MRLFYRIYGSGHPLIILHGLFGSSDNWISIARSLSSKFMVVLPDQRNHGQSPHSQIHDYNSMKEDLDELVNELGWKNFFLAGHSMGGKVAVNYALSWPEKLDGLIVADISPFSQKSSESEDFVLHKKILDYMINENISRFKARNEISSNLSRNINSEKVRELVLKNLRRRSDNTFTWKINAMAIRENLHRMAEGIKPAYEYFPEIKGFPILFLRGEYSDYLQFDDYADILRVFPGCEFITIPGAGHWIHADNPEAVKDCFMRLVDYS